MSPTLSDDTLVRELTGRADRAVPAMSLDPVGVLAASRWHHRRQTALRSAAGLAAVAAVAVGAAQLWPGHSAVPPVGPSDPAFALGIEVEIPEDAAVISTDTGTVVDTGLNLYGLEYENPADATRLVLAQTLFPPEAPTTVGVQVLALSPEGTAEPLAAYGLADLTETPDAWWGAEGTGGHVMYIMGVAPLGLEEGEGAVVVSPGTTDEPIRFPLLMITVPGFDREVFLAVIRDSPGSDAAWPTMVVEWVGPDGTVMTTPTLDGGSGDTEPVEADVADSDLTIQVAQDVREADSSAGRVLDLGVPVLNGFARQTTDGREDMTYALLATTWGEFTGDTTLTEAEAGAQAVALAGRRSFGALTPMSGSLVTGPHDTVDATGRRGMYNGSPVLAAGIGESDADVLGLLPDGATGATLVVERATGTERITLPTLTVPGLPGDAAFFFFTLHDEVTQVALAPAYLELAAADGTVTRWAVTGALD